MSSLSPAQSTRGGRNAADDDSAAQNIRELLVPIRSLLKARGVDFDPRLLFDDNWRALIEPALVRMPEMGQTLRVTEPMGGVYLAGTILLPERISLKSDTLILTRDLAPDDENSVINISGGHRLFIFNVGDRGKYEAMVRNGAASQILNIDVDAACVVVGIAPMYLGTYRCRERGYFGGWKKRN